MSETNTIYRSVPNPTYSLFYLTSSMFNGVFNTSFYLTADLSQAKFWTFATQRWTEQGVDFQELEDPALEAAQAYLVDLSAK